jgi:uncharacterized cupredoxin-like copper-binding protein
MRWIALVAAVVAFAGIGAGISMAAARADAPVEISIRYSRFGPTSVQVPVGRAVAFVIANEDPIDHEWIVGADGVHVRHRTGTEPAHESRPTEVTIPAGEVRRTSVVFETPGTYRFICHLPGHEAYGMVGTVVVRP